MANGTLYQPTRTRRDLNALTRDLANHVATPLMDHDHSGDVGDGGAFDAANLQSGAATDGQVLTADGAGGAAWEAVPALSDHDHSGDPGDGGAFPADNLASGIASANKVLTADGFGQTVWKYPVTQNHGHSGGAGDGGIFNAANLSSGAATSGRVLTANGSGGAAWSSLPALANHDHNGNPGDGGKFNAANLTSGASGSGQVLTSNGVGGATWNDPSGDMLWSVIQASQLCNEFKGFPALVGTGVDLVATDQWFENIASPSAQVRMVALAGEGITEGWEYGLKLVADSALDGFNQRYTYDDEPRIKSGKKLSAIAAVWLATANRTLTMKLRTSAGSEVSVTNSISGAWVIMRCENLTLNGSYVELEFYLNNSGTFYVVPLGVNIGPKAVPLPPRGLVYREAIGSPTVVNGVDPGGAGFTDVDCTANCSPLACKLNLNGLYRNATRTDQTLSVRRNGDTTGWGQSYLVRSQSTTAFTAGTQIVLCDDSQIFEYMTNCAAADTEAVYIKLLGWWEWA